jgi:hypothetical protein
MMTFTAQENQKVVLLKQQEFRPDALEGSRLITLLLAVVSEDSEQQKDFLLSQYVSSITDGSSKTQREGTGRVITSFTKTEKTGPSS